MGSLLENHMNLLARTQNCATVYHFIGKKSGVFTGQGAFLLFFSFLFFWKVKSFVCCLEDILFLFNMLSHGGPKLSLWSWRLH